jgi:hypothetical protein
VFVKTIVLVLFCLSLSVPSGAADTINPKDFVRLQDVVPKVQEVLIAAQKELADSNSWQLKTAEFDFQTVTTSKIEGGITAFIIVGDVSHEKDTTEEIDYSYEVPAAKTVQTALAASPQAGNKLFVAKRPFSTSPNYEAQVVDVYTGVKAIIDWFRNINHTTDPETLSNSLLGAIVAGGKSMSEAAVLTTPTGKGLSGDSYTVSIGFTVTNSADVGVDATKLVAASPTAKYTGSRQNVQTVKLTFVKPN